MHEAEAQRAAAAAVCLLVTAAKSCYRCIEALVLFGGLWQV